MADKTVKVRYPANRTHGLVRLGSYIVGNVYEVDEATAKELLGKGFEIVNDAAASPAVATSAAGETSED